MAQDIDKLNVQNIMLRNSSFSVLIFAVIFAVEFFIRGYDFGYAIGSVACLGISIILARESIKFAAWFVQATYKSLVALVVTSEQLPVKFKSKARPTGRKQKTGSS